MRLAVLTFFALALALAGCSGSKKAANVPEEKRVGNFVYAPPPGANGEARQPGQPGVPPALPPREEGAN